MHPRRHQRRQPGHEVHRLEHDVRGAVAIRGLFRYRGEYTSESNESFDTLLHARDPQSGIRDFEDVDALARAAGFEFVADHPMPANNQALIWKATPGQARIC
jgi:cytochrome oxidase assembly protein ShyY1